MASGGGIPPRSPHPCPRITYANRFFFGGKPKFLTFINWLPKAAKRKNVHIIFILLFLLRSRRLLQVLPQKRQQSERRQRRKCQPSPGRQRTAPARSASLPTAPHSSALCCRSCSSQRAASDGEWGGHPSVCRF